MPVFVTLLKYSAEGMKGISPERLERQRQLIESKGGKLLTAYGLMGEWDVLWITEFPDEKRAMGALLSTCQSGIGSTQTMIAIPIDEFVRLG